MAKPVREVLQQATEELNDLADYFDQGAIRRDDNLCGALASFQCPALAEAAWDLPVEYEYPEATDPRHAVRNVLGAIEAVTRALEDAERFDDASSLRASLADVRTALGDAGGASAEEGSREGGSD